MLEHLLQLLRRPSPPGEAVRAGFYHVGETPTVLKGAVAPVGTHVHEQTHRDTISNTFFGYVLLRMSDLADLPDAAPQRNEVVGLLTRRAWNVFEGVATAAEFLTLIAVEPTLTMKAFKSKLPPDYQRAWAPFETLMKPHVCAKATDHWPLLIIGLVQAVSECILDTGFYVRGAKPVDFLSWLSIARQTPFDELTTEYMKMAQYLDGERIIGLMPSTGLKGDPEGVAFRSWVQALKLALLEIAGSRIPDPLISTDFVRLTLVAEADRKLHAAIPELPGRSFQTDRLAEAAIAYQIQEKQSILPHELVELSSLEQRLGTYLSDYNVFHLVLTFTPENALGNRLVLLPVLQQQFKLDDGRNASKLYCDHALLAVPVSADALTDMSRRVRSEKITWLSVVIPFQFKPEIDPLIVFLDPIRNLEQHVYLYCTAFHSDWLHSVMGRIGTPAVLENADFPGLQNRLVLRAVIGRFSLFWILMGVLRQSDGSVQLDELRFEAIGSDADDSFTAAVLATELGVGAIHEEE